MGKRLVGSSVGVAVKGEGRQTWMVWIVLMVLLAWSPALWGQADTGRITGKVVDPTGAVIPGATVTATRTDTGDVSTTTTDQTGVYLFPSLRNGLYSVAASMKGFSDLSKQGIELDDNAALTIDLKLTPGDKQEIEVTTTVVDTVNTTTGEVSHVIDGDTVRDLALNGRNYLDLLGTLPGSVQASLGDAISETTSMTTTNINLNGARATANGLYIDGFLNKDNASNAAQFNNVGIDFIEHVKVSTSSFSAVFGQSAGPVVNVVSRSGANTIHGSVFEYVRNNALDATNYFSRNLTTYQPIHQHLRFNDFGFALGRPIKRDKLFFFIGTEWKLIAQTTNPSLVTLPTQAWLAGNFTTALGGCGFNTPAYVASSGNASLIAQWASAQKSCNLTGLITPFGQSVINVFNASIAQAVSYCGSGTGCQATGNGTFELPYPYRNHQYMARVDWVINKRNTAYGRWFADTHSTTNPIGDGSLPVDAYHDEAPANNVLLSHTLVVSPSAYNEISFGSLFQSTNYQPYGTAWLRSTYGFSYQPFYVNGDKLGIPSVSIFGLNAWDSDSYLKRYHPTYLQVQDLFTKVAGRHSLKFGALVGRNRADINGQANFAGGASFTPTLSSNTTNSGFADALLGNYQSYTETPTDTFGQFRALQVAGFVDDVWRAAARLSLNFGLRTEFITPWYTKQNNTADFYPSSYSTAGASYVDPNGFESVGAAGPFNGMRRSANGVPPSQYFRVPNATAASVLAVPAGTPRGFYKAQTVFMPRIGGAYNIFGDGSTAIRFGAGLFYDFPQANANFSTLILPPYLSGVSLENGNMDNLGNASTAQAYPQPAMYTLDPNFQRTYVYQYNFGVQQQFGKDIFFQVNYVGSEGRHLLRHPDINGVDPTVEDCITAYYTSSTTAGGLGMSAPVLDYMRQYTGATLPSNIKNSLPCQALPPINSNGYGGYAGWDAIYQWRSDVDYNYNGLQVNVNRRVGKGRFTLAYTFSKALSTGSADTDVDHIELYSKQYNYGPVSFDRRNILTSTYIVQTPLMRGRNLVLREGLGAWMVSGTARYQGGTYNTATGTDEEGVGSRANYCGYPVAYGHTALAWWYLQSPAPLGPAGSGAAGQGIQNFAAPTVYAPNNAHWSATNPAPCAGNYTTGVGDAPVGNIIGPNLINVDLSLRKTFNLGERRNLTLNFDSFNIFNHPNFSVPYLNVNAPNYSIVNNVTTSSFEGVGSAGRPRNLSAGARFYF